MAGLILSISVYNRGTCNMDQFDGSLVKIARMMSMSSRCLEINRQLGPAKF